MVKDKKDRFDILNSNAAVELKEDSHLKEDPAVKEKRPAKKNQMVYGVPLALTIAIEKSGESFSSFSKRSMMRLSKEEGII